MQTVVVVDYDPAWPQVFQQLYARIWPVVGDVAVRIEHVGSTAVPGLAAKPIIDMTVVVPSPREVPLAIKRLATLGYEHRGDLGIAGREAFTRPAGLPAHNLYVSPPGTLGLQNQLAVRDYLRTHPDAARAYGDLKKRLALEFPNDIISYIDGKTDLLLAILQEQGLSADRLAAIERANRKTLGCVSIAGSSAMTALILPTNEASRRHALAQQLIHGLRLQPNQEVVLTGSVARGVSDRFSDIEIRFLVDTLEPPHVYDEQLRAAGAQVEPATCLWNGMITSKSWFEGVFIEAAWQTWDGLEQGLVPVLAAETTEHWALVEAWHIFHALPLTDALRIKHWQQQLAHYPDALQTKLITSALATWVQPHWYPTSPVNVWPVAQRNARMALTTKLIQEIEPALRLVFAVNTQWEPDYKWLWFEQHRLQHKPQRLAERVNEVFATPDAAHSIALCFHLILDILMLVPPPHNVSMPMQRITEALHPDNLLRH